MKPLKVELPDGTHVELEYGESLFPPEKPDEIGRIGPYRLLQVLGSGGMGVVFKAEVRLLQHRMAALKIMLPSLARSATARERFLREIRAGAACDHENVVRIYDADDDRGVPYLVMQLLEGESLDQRLKRVGKLPIGEVVRVGRQIAQGLAFVHRQGLIHRDIEPSNIFLEFVATADGRRTTDPRVKIIDFGLVRAVATPKQFVQSGAVIGTPASTAPEQAAGQSIDHRCDLFSLGCVLYQMCTGEKPFKGADTASTLMAVATHQPPQLHELNAEVPLPFSSLVMKLLAKKPEDRPQSAQEVADALAKMGTKSTMPRWLRRLLGMLSLIVRPGE